MTKRFLQHFGTLQRLQAKADRECGGGYNSWDLDNAGERYLLINDSNNILGVFSRGDYPYTYVEEFPLKELNVESLVDEDEFGSANCIFRKVYPDGNSLRCLESVIVETYLNRYDSVSIGNLQKILDGHKEITEKDSQNKPFDLYTGVKLALGYIENEST